MRSELSSVLHDADCLIERLIELTLRRDIHLNQKEPIRLAIDRVEAAAAHLIDARNAE